MLITNKLYFRSLCTYLQHWMRRTASRFPCSSYNRSFPTVSRYQLQRPRWPYVCTLNQKIIAHSRAGDSYEIDGNAMPKTIRAPLASSLARVNISVMLKNVVDRLRLLSLAGEMFLSANRAANREDKGLSLRRKQKSHDRVRGPIKGRYAVIDYRIG